MSFDGSCYIFLAFFIATKIEPKMRKMNIGSCSIIEHVVVNNWSLEATHIYHYLICIKKGSSVE